MGVDLTSKRSGRFVKTLSPTIRCCYVDETVDTCSQAPEKCRLSVIDSLLLAVHRSLYHRDSVYFRIGAPGDCVRLLLWAELSWWFLFPLFLMVGI
jgi:hypothetical protein